MTGAARDSSWPWSSEPMKAKCEDGAPEATAFCSGSDECQMDKAAEASSCHVSVEEQHHSAVPWHGGKQRRELLATRKGTKKRRPSFQHGACRSCLWSCLAKWWGICMWGEKTIENNSIIGWLAGWNFSRGCDYTCHYLLTFKTCVVHLKCQNDAHAAICVHADCGDGLGEGPGGLPNGHRRRKGTVPGSQCVWRKWTWLPLKGGVPPSSAGTKQDTSSADGRQGSSEDPREGAPLLEADLTVEEFGPGLFKFPGYWNSGGGTLTPAKILNFYLVLGIRTIMLCCTLGPAQCLSLMY